MFSVPCVLFIDRGPYALLVRRDLGAGLIAQKEGSPSLSPHFNSPLALAWHQHKGVVFAWAIGIAFLGGTMGAAAPNISESINFLLVEMNFWGAALAKLGNQEGFIAVYIYILGLMAGLSVFAITIVLSLWKEEKENHAEAVLSRAVYRSNWMGSYLVIAFSGSAFILFALGLASGLGWSIADGDSSHILRVLAMSLSKFPSVCVFIGISALLYGWLPRIASVLSWFILGLFIFIEVLWEVGAVGWTALKLTPFAYAHYSISIDELAIGPLIVLLFISAALAWFGIVGFGRRSID